MERTIIIESNRQIANDSEKETLTSLTSSDPIPNNKWTTRVESGIPIEVGDRISVEASMVNVRGSPDNTMEFSGTSKEANAFGVIDNLAQIDINYYMTNQQKFNFNLPHNNTLVKKAQAQAVDVDFGGVDLSTFNNFKLSYPYNSIEDSGVTVQRPPTELYYTSPARLYYIRPQDGWENGTILNKNILATATKQFKIPQGFNTPTAVGQQLTEQLHERIGDASNWGNRFVSGFVANIVNGAISTFSNPLITDFCYSSVPTSTGDIILQRSLGEWDAKVAGETGGAEGTGYTEAQGRKVFHKNMLCGNPDQYSAVISWNNTRNARYYQGQDTQRLYTGVTTVADSSGTQAGCLGCYPVLLDNMNKEASATQWQYSPSGRAADTQTQTDLDLLIWGEYTLFPTNIVYSGINLASIKDAFSSTEKIEGQNITPLTESDKDYTVYLQFGRADDSTTHGAEQRKTHLPKPNTLSLPAGHVSDVDGVGTNNIANSYITNSDGKKAYIGLVGSNTKTQIPFLSRFVDNIMDINKDATKVKFATGSYFGLKNSKNQYGDFQLSQQNNVGVIPVFYSNPATGLVDVPFCAFVSSTDSNGQIVPYPQLGEFFGFSPSLCDNLLAKIVTTQKKQTGNPDAKGKWTYTAGKNVTDYMPYCMIGADNATVKFDDSYGKFVISDLHTSVRQGSGSFATPLDVANEQATQESMSFNRSGNFLASINPAGVITDLIVQSSGTLPTISAQAGISIAAISPYTTQEGPNGFPSIMNPFDPRQPERYTGSLFEKMGFQLEQLLPFDGGIQNEFNRTSYNRALGKTIASVLKQRGMVKPFTTNAYISGADQLGVVLNDNNDPMGNLGTTPSEQTVNTNAVSDELVAVGVPSKLNFSYLVVYSDIVRNSSYYGGRSGQQKVPAMAYITRNDTTGDFIYQFTTNWDYIADSNYIISDITTDIRLPNGNPADIEKNSAVIYKITKPMSLPPPPVEPKKK